MKNLIIVLFLLFQYVQSSTLYSDLNTNSVRQLPKIILSGKLNELKETPTLKIKRTDITLIVHTQANPDGSEIALSDANRTMEISPFNGKLKTVFFIHGWNDGLNKKSCPAVRDALLANANVNIIIVNWDECAKNLDYFISKSCVPDVGKYVGEFLVTLSQTYSYSLTDITVVGHSLGAHIAGFVGKYTNGVLGIIVGLDPAGPFYQKDDRDSRLNEYDAQYVQAIHTNAALLGVKYNVGKSDFWPNGGLKQPGCLATDLVCSHRNSWKYYVESLSNNQFYAKQCDSYDSYLAGKCNQNSKSLAGGLNINTTVTGTYYLETNSESPFGKGDI